MADEPTVTMSQGAFLQLLACALSYNSRLPYGQPSLEVVGHIPAGWLEEYWDGEDPMTSDGFCRRCGGEIITKEIEADPVEVERLRRAREQARQGQTTSLSDVAVQVALEKAAFEIERELVCCDAIEQGPDHLKSAHPHEICYWGGAAREIVREVASGQRP